MRNCYPIQLLYENDNNSKTKTILIYPNITIEEIRSVFIGAFDIQEKGTIVGIRDVENNVNYPLRFISLAPNKLGGVFFFHL